MFNVVQITLFVMRVRRQQKKLFTHLAFISCSVAHIVSKYKKKIVIADIYRKYVTLTHVFQSVLHFTADVRKSQPAFTVL